MRASQVFSPTGKPKLISSQAIRESAQGSAKFPLLLDLRQVAELTSLGYQSLRNQIQQGRLPFRTILVGSRRLVRTADLLDWVESLGADASERQEGHLPTAVSPQAPADSMAARPRGRPRQSNKLNSVGSPS